MWFGREVDWFEEMIEVVDSSGAVQETVRSRAKICGQQFGSDLRLYLFRS